MHTLRPYQRDCVTAVVAGFREYLRQLVVAPTGAGKTIIIAELARQGVDATGKPALVIAHRDELIQQNREKIIRQTGLWCSTEKAESRGDRMSQVVVASVQTISRRLENWPRDHFGRVFIDEFHHATSESYRRVMEHFDSAELLGLTATPERSDKRRIASLVDNIPYQISTFELIDAGYLAPIMVQHVPISIDLSQVRVVAGDYRDDDLDSALAPYFEEIIRSVIEHAAGRKILAFVPLVKTSRMLTEIAQSYDIRAEHIDGASEDRAQILERFSRGDIQMLTNASLLLEGYDEPSIDCVLMLRPTKSKTLYRQCVGRGTRLHPGKENLLLLDYLWQTEKHGLVSPAHLIAETDEEAEAITRKTREKQMALSLGSLSNAVRADREAAIAEEIYRNQRRGSRLYDAREIGLALRDASVYEYEPLVAWEHAAISEKQRATLERHGIDLDTVQSKGHASKIINAIFRRRAEGLCSLKQMHCLIRNGFPGDPERATFGEAHAFINGLNGYAPASLRGVA